MMRRFPAVAATSSLTGGLLIALSGMPSYLLQPNSMISYSGTIAALPKQEASLIALEFLALGLLVVIGGGLLYLDPYRHRIWGAMVLAVSSFNYVVGLDVTSILGLMGGLVGIAWNPATTETRPSLGNYQRRAFL